MGTSITRTSGVRPGPIEKGLQARLAALGGRAGPSEARRAARALGVFSVGLGTAELAAPRLLATVTGAGRTLPGRLLVRAFGARELLPGAGLLAGGDPAPWLWARVAGDAVDLGALALAFATRRPGRRRGRVRLAVSTAAVLGVTAADAVLAARCSVLAGRLEADGTLRVRVAVTLDVDAEEAYRRWRRFEELPGALHHLQAVQAVGEGRTHWSARGPLGRTVTWDAEVVEDDEPRRIAWRSIDRSGIENRGSVRFDPAPKGRGTEVAVELWYAPPGGMAGAAFAVATGEGVRDQLRDDLYRFKQLVETGGIVRSEGTPEGAAIRHVLRQRPARPAA